MAADGQAWTAGNLHTPATSLREGAVWTEEAGLIAEAVWIEDGSGRSATIL